MAFESKAEDGLEEEENTLLACSYNHYPTLKDFRW